MVYNSELRWGHANLVFFMWANEWNSFKELTPASRQLKCVVEPECEVQGGFLVIKQGHESTEAKDMKTATNN